MPISLASATPTKRALARNTLGAKSSHYVEEAPNFVTLRTGSPAT
jgi:hypothetical protein